MWKRAAAASWVLSSCSAVHTAALCIVSAVGKKRTPTKKALFCNNFHSVGYWSPRGFFHTSFMTFSSWQVTKHWAVRTFNMNWLLAAHLLRLELPVNWNNLESFVWTFLTGKQAVLRAVLRIFLLLVAGSHSAPCAALTISAWSRTATLQWELCELCMKQRRREVTGFQVWTGQGLGRAAVVEMS